MAKSRLSTNLTNDEVVVSTTKPQAQSSKSGESNRRDSINDSSCGNSDSSSTQISPASTDGIQLNKSSGWNADPSSTEITSSSSSISWNQMEGGSTSVGDPFPVTPAESSLFASPAPEESPLNLWDSPDQVFKEQEQSQFRDDCNSNVLKRASKGRSRRRASAGGSMYKTIQRDKDRKQPANGQSRATPSFSTSVEWAREGDLFPKPPQQGQNKDDNDDDKNKNYENGFLGDTTPTSLPDNSKRKLFSKSSSFSLPGWDSSERLFNENEIDQSGNAFKSPVGGRRRASMGGPTSPNMHEDLNGDRKQAGPRRVTPIFTTSAEWSKEDAFPRHSQHGKNKDDKKEDGKNGTLDKSSPAVLPEASQKATALNSSSSSLTRWDSVERLFKEEDIAQFRNEFSAKRPGRRRRASLGGPMPHDDMDGDRKQPAHGPRRVTPLARPSTEWSKEDFFPESPEPNRNKGHGVKNKEDTNGVVGDSTLTMLLETSERPTLLNSSASSLPPLGGWDSSNRMLKEDENQDDCSSRRMVRTSVGASQDIKDCDTKQEASGQDRSTPKFCTSSDWTNEDFFPKNSLVDQNKVDVDKNVDDKNCISVGPAPIDGPETSKKSAVLNSSSSSLPGWLSSDRMNKEEESSQIPEDGSSTRKERKSKRRASVGGSMYKDIRGNKDRDRKQPGNKESRVTPAFTTSTEWTRHDFSPKQPRQNQKKVDDGDKNEDGLVGDSTPTSVPDKGVRRSYSKSSSFSLPRWDSADRLFNEEEIAQFRNDNNSTRGGRRRRASLSGATSPDSSDDLDGDKKQPAHRHRRATPVFSTSAEWSKEESFPRHSNHKQTKDSDDKNDPVHHSSGDDVKTHNFSSPLELKTNDAYGTTTTVQDQGQGPEHKSTSRNHVPLRDRQGVGQGGDLRSPLHAIWDCDGSTLDAAKAYSTVRTQLLNNEQNHASLSDLDRRTYLASVLSWKSSPSPSNRIIEKVRFSQKQLLLFSSSMRPDSDSRSSNDEEAETIVTIDTEDDENVLDEKDKNQFHQSAPELVGSTENESITTDATEFSKSDAGKQELKRRKERRSSLSEKKSNEKETSAHKGKLKKSSSTGEKSDSFKKRHKSSKEDSASKEKKTASRRHSNETKSDIHNDEFVSTERNSNIDAAEVFKNEKSDCFGGEAAENVLHSEKTSTNLSPRTSAEDSPSHKKSPVGKSILKDEQSRRYKPTGQDSTSSLNLANLVDNSRHSNSAKQDSTTSLKLDPPGGRTRSERVPASEKSRHSRSSKHHSAPSLGGLNGDDSPISKRRSSVSSKLASKGDKSGHSRSVKEGSAASLKGIPTGDESPHSESKSRTSSSSKRASSGDSSRRSRSVPASSLKGDAPGDESRKKHSSSSSKRTSSGDKSRHSRSVREESATSLKGVATGDESGHSRSGKHSSSRGSPVTGGDSSRRSRSVPATKLKGVAADDGSCRSRSKKPSSSSSRRASTGDKSRHSRSVKEDSAISADDSGQTLPGQRSSSPGKRASIGDSIRRSRSVPATSSKGEAATVDSSNHSRSKKHSSSSSRRGSTGHKSRHSKSEMEDSAKSLNEVATGDDSPSRQGSIGHHSSSKKHSSSSSRRASTGDKSRHSRSAKEDSASSLKGAATGDKSPRSESATHLP